MYTNFYSIILIINSHSEATRSRISNIMTKTAKDDGKKEILDNIHLRTSLWVTCAVVGRRVQYVCLCCIANEIELEYGAKECQSIP